VTNATADAFGQATPGSDFAANVTKRYGEATQISAFDGVTTIVTEMDALVAYIQVLGQLTQTPYDKSGSAKQSALLPVDVGR